MNPFKLIWNWIKKLFGITKANFEDIVEEFGEATDKLGDDLELSYDELKDKTKKELDELAEKVYNIKLDVRKTKDKMIDELLEEIDKLKGK